jgi:hypothetical protein
MSDRIEFSPNPIIQNVPVTITARLTNPNNFPIVINGTFGFTQMGIGLTFGPIGTVTNKVIPANSDAVFSTVWTPIISGHYCFQFQYSYGTQGPVPAGVQPLSGGGLAQRNQDTQPAPFTTPGQHESLNKAKNVIGNFNNGQDALSVVTDGPIGFLQGKIGFLIPNMLVDKLLDFDFNAAGQISDALSGDPPRQDYKVLATVQPIPFTPLVAGPDLPKARADAANAFITAMLDMTAKGQAAAITFDRYGGATAAHDMTWASLQATTYLKYKYDTGQAMITAGKAFDAFLQELRNEGVTGLTVTPQTYKAYQDQLKMQGHFDQDDIDAAHKLGYTDDQIAAEYQRRIGLDPNDAAVDLMQAGAQTAAALQEAGYALIAPPPMPSISVGGSAGILPSSVTPQDAINPNLARAYAATYTFQVANPQAQPATINLNIRRINLPNDWSIDAPASVTLDPGKSTTVTVTVTAGMPVVQETQPSLAIEGYINSNYIGGVVLDVLVPSSQPQLNRFIPVAQRKMTAGW